MDDYFELELYDSDTALSNIVYNTFSLHAIEDRPFRDWCQLFDSKPESETTSESDAQNTSNYEEGTDDSAIELVSVSLPHKSKEMATASSGKGSNSS